MYLVVITKIKLRSDLFYRKYGQKIITQLLYKEWILSLWLDRMIMFEKIKGIVQLMCFDLSFATELVL